MCECDKCGGFNLSEVYCGECVKRVWEDDWREQLDRLADPKTGSYGKIGMASGEALKSFIQSLLDITPSDTP